MRKCPRTFAHTLRQWVCKAQERLAPTPTAQQHRYRVTLEHLVDPQGNPSTHAPLQFEVKNHHDIIGIVQRLRSRGDFDEDTATAFGVGLKLFSEVMLENREHPLFASLRPRFAAFMKELKAGPLPTDASG